MTVSAKQLPPQILQADPSGDLARRVGEFCETITAAAGANLVSLIIFGGVARGRYRPGQSDVNALIVLHDASTGQLKLIAPALRAAFRSFRLEPMILTRAEIPAIGATFPTKLLDIKDHHVLLAGENVLSSIEVSRDRVLIRIEQELRNLALRLRQRTALGIEDPAALMPFLAGMARSAAIELSSLLQIKGESVPEQDRSAIVFAHAARVFGLDQAALADLSQIRDQRKQPPDLESTINGILTSLSIATDAAAGMPR